MAIYSTFFLARPIDLLSGFPDWKPPLPKPIVRHVKNPFTGEAMTVTTNAPDWDDVESEDHQLSEIRVVAGSGDYDAYLEGRVPEFVRQSPHSCLKNLTNIDIEPLVAAATGRAVAQLQSAIFAPPTKRSLVLAIPDELVAALATVDEPSLRRIAEAWAAELSTPDYTHASDGQRISDDRTTDEMLEIVNFLASLARCRTDGHCMYLLLE
jgi:hypothetical protein